MMRFWLSIVLASLVLPAWAEEAAKEEAPETAEKPAVMVKQSPQKHYSIMAVVNDDVISSLDVEERMKLIITTTGRPDTPETRRVLAAKVVGSLIDEKLKIQAAKQQNIAISRKDIDVAIKRIEMNQGKGQGSLEKLIAGSGLSVKSFHEQIKSEVAWNKILARKIKRNVVITDEEIQRSRKRIASGKKVEEWQIASLLFPVKDGAERADIQAKSLQVREQLLSGKNLSDVMKALGDETKVDVAPSTWVRRDYLNPAIEKVLQTLDEGGIAPPAHTPEGVQLIRLLDRRSRVVKPNANAEVALKQIVLGMEEKSSDFEIDVMMDVARSIAKHPGSCMHKGIAGTNDLEGLNISVNYIRTTLSNMSPELRPMVEPMSVAQITEPFAAPDGIHLLMLCERIEMPAPLPDPEEVRQVLFQEKLELEAEKYLRGLKREAFIDIRV